MESYLKNVSKNPKVTNPQEAKLLKLSCDLAKAVKDHRNGLISDYELRGVEASVLEQALYCGNCII